MASIPFDGYINDPYFHHPDKICRRCKVKPARLNKKTKWGTYCPKCQSEIEKGYRDPKGYLANRVERHIIKSDMEELHDSFHLMATIMRIEEEQAILRASGHDPSTVNCVTADRILASQFRLTHSNAS